ncbi:RHS repeat domain-containing protein [Pseudomonas thivervalensis]|uniref:Toxin n=1 Tax=Pseudomonas thivervalensis TaxID=86265 RepID=A0A176NRG3_9PSED|nr:RHS repeat-associated core domain-containing protein [Pseudomonas thivervalensis]AXA56901.1 toxin [Pseudomonas thivervalensis]AXA62714.1 toxin [Pseudomonas thivervalensis]OAB53723.1 toxin [Pseudomonas thivervalensis]SDG51906.1 insecticidal toxin complex protein TccC [Pseudomonas thivervalensis]
MSAIHFRTPSIVAVDGRGLPVRQTVYLRDQACDSTTALISRLRHNVVGQLVEQRDPRLCDHATLPNQATCYTLADDALRTDSVDAGWRLVLPGPAGETLQRWDERGSHWQIAYDPQLRPLTVEEQHQVEIETFIYADASADASHNLRGQLLALADASGVLSRESYGLLGQALEETRTFHDGRVFNSRWIFGPSGAVLEQTDAGEHQRQSHYDVAGQLTQVRLRLKSQNDWQPVLHNARYNAAGQIIEQHAGNGVVSYWTYDPANASLVRQCAKKGQAPALQDFEYVHDPMGNVTRILDHAFTPTHFANQRVDGHRAFSYDSLYRLLSASGYDDGPPSDTPGLPQPTDPNHRLNYLQTYEYDHGGNLTKLQHVRAGASHTRQMYIDPGSNRGVRWTPGDPVPSFDTLFDRHGNLQALLPGQDLQWNARDQPESVTLVDRARGPNDTEQYRYSQGLRVYKRHDIHTPTNSHFQAVHYLPGLEVRTRDNGEQLHVITLDTGPVSVRCLHWVAGKPAGIDGDQLRYGLNDHLGSSLMELDQHAQLISHEGYYPFGATAWMAARSAIEVSYKTVRYSGKEMDASGLYYYGARYYAPWLLRWISADPAGHVDGQNRYAFVENNPLRYVDPDGQHKAEAVITFYSDVISELNKQSRQLLGQLHTIIQQKSALKNLAGNLLGEVVKGVLGFESGVIGGGQVDLVLGETPVIAPYATPGGLIGGNGGGDLFESLADPVISPLGLMGPLIPQTSQLSVEAIDRKLGYPPPAKPIHNWRDVKSELIHPALNSIFNPSFLMTRVMTTWIPILAGAMNMGSRAQEAEDIKHRLTPVKITKIETMLADWKSAIEQRSTLMEAAFDELGTDVIYPRNLLPNVNFMTPAEMLTPIRRSALRYKTQATLANIAQAQRGLAAYREMGTTDNQYLRRQRRTGRR